MFKKRPTHTPLHRSRGPCRLSFRFFYNRHFAFGVVGFWVFRLGYSALGGQWEGVKKCGYHFGGEKGAKTNPHAAAPPAHARAISRAAGYACASEPAMPHCGAAAIPRRALETRLKDDARPLFLAEARLVRRRTRRRGVSRRAKYATDVVGAPSDHSADGQTPSKNDAANPVVLR